MKKYEFAIYTRVYIFLTFVSVLLFTFTQINVFFQGTITDWRLRTFGWFWLGKSIYYTWFVRLQSVKSLEESKFYSSSIKTKTKMKQPSSDVWAFLLETYNRMGQKSPRFFQVIQAIGVIAALITGIPLAIQQFEMFTSIKIGLPDIVNSTLIRIVFFCGVIVKIMGKLPVATPPETQPEKNPFTAKKEGV